MIARNIINGSKAATGPVDSNVSREVELLYKKFHSCWCNEFIEGEQGPDLPPILEVKEVVMITKVMARFTSLKS